MFAAFLLLCSWRLTGLVLHEWIGLAIILTIVAHLMVHWGWVETRTAGALHRSHRRLGALLLNAALFAAMGTALVSGIAISKVVLARPLTPAVYLTWHELHETSSNLSVALMALHVAYNWDRIKGSAREAFARARRVPARALRWSDIEPGTALRRLLWIAGVSAVLTGAVVADARLFPSNEQVMRVYADGRREMVPPPPELVRRNPPDDWPQLGRGAASRLVLNAAALLGLAILGRRAMRWKRSRRTAAAPAPRLSTRTE